MSIVRSGDAEIYFEDTGSGDPMLLIMGLGADIKGWTLQTPVFSQTHRVIQFDNRGVGRSSTPPGPYSTEGMARDALAVLDACDVGRAHVVGVSLGGTIAQHLALMAPDRVRSLVLTSTWAGPSAYRTRLREIQMEILDKVGHEALTRARMLFVFTPGLFQHDKLMDLIESNMNEGTSPEGYLAQYDAAEAHDLRARLGEIAAPTLVMTGTRDMLVPRELTEEVARLVPGSTLMAMETAHTIQFEMAEAFNRAVLEFVGSH